jgi:RHS repeat-associated protein
MNPQTSKENPVPATTTGPAQAGPATTDVHYGYDMLGRPVAVGTVEQPELFAAYVYQPDGLPAEERLAGGAVRRRLVRDPLGRLIELADPAFTQRLSFRQGGDATKPFADGHISAESVGYHAEGFAGPPPAGAGYVYRYDPFGRLVAAQPGSGPDALELGYDPDGNIEAVRRGGVTSDYAYQPGTNRVVEVSEQGRPAGSFTYDPDGAVRTHGRLGLTLDRDRITGLTWRATRESSTLLFCHDAGGRRVLRQDGTDRRLTVRGLGGEPLVDVSPGQGSTVHVHGPSGLVGLSIDGVHHSVSTDNRGSVRVVRASGGAVAQFDYGPFGELQASSGELTGAVLVRYTGREWDPGLGLYDFGARLYDPELARFLSVDPADESASPYVYVDNDPVGGVDPDGRAPLKVYFSRGTFYLFVRGSTTPWARIQVHPAQASRLIVAWGPIDLDHMAIKSSKTAARFKAIKAGTALNDWYISSRGKLRERSAPGEPVPDTTNARMATKGKSLAFKNARALNRGWKLGDWSELRDRAKIAAGRNRDRLAGRGSWAPTFAPEKDRATEPSSTSSPSSSSSSSSRSTPENDWDASDVYSNASSDFGQLPPVPKAKVPVVKPPTGTSTKTRTNFDPSSTSSTTEDW